MNYKKIFVFFFTIICINAKSQNFEIEIFKSICVNLSMEDQKYVQKKRFKGIYLAEDPTTGKKYIKHLADVDKQVLADFKRIEKKEQISILETDSLPIFPLKDTILIIDSIGFFSSDLSLFHNNHFFKIVKNNNLMNEHFSFLYLYKIGVKKNNIVLSLKFNPSPLYYNLFFTISPKTIKITKTTFIKF
jgi:hypothetical protein